VEGVARNAEEEATFGIASGPRLNAIGGPGKGLGAYIGVSSSSCGGPGRQTGPQSGEEEKSETSVIANCKLTGMAESWDREVKGRSREERKGWNLRVVVGEEEINCASRDWRGRSPSAWQRRMGI